MHKAKPSATYITTYTYCKNTFTSSFIYIYVIQRPHKTLVYLASMHSEEGGVKVQ